MVFPDPAGPTLVRLSWRSDATFVRVWFALGLGILVIGHIVYALKGPEARRGMRAGRVSSRWARAEHAAWVDEIGDTDPGGSEARR
ncbi:hypothetical protein H4N58_01915 [Mumia sp. ZJ1417]|uniref:hypothetical protein n=1 Tax=Mumia sp. ZJ1417 TaxID=2708082 RepID=UPI0015FE1A20|nr:hypothetical protein [Mumia sp. ZJ1417]QMW66747.1 hypothetical protein H4N58_01915 [Mumia sp. ZJ1417]